MENEFTLVEEQWRDSLQRFMQTIDSSAFQGDAPREHMRDELIQVLAKSKAVLSAGREVSSSMNSIYMLMDEGMPLSKDKRLRR